MGQEREGLFGYRQEGRPVLPLEGEYTHGLHIILCKGQAADSFVCWVFGCWCLGAPCGSLISSGCFFHMHSTPVPKLLRGFHFVYDLRQVTVPGHVVDVACGVDHMVALVKSII